MNNAHNFSEGQTLTVTATRVPVYADSMREATYRQVTQRFRVRRVDAETGRILGKVNGKTRVIEIHRDGSASMRNLTGRPARWEVLQINDREF